MVAALALAASLTFIQSGAPAGGVEIIAELRVHGNQVATDADVIALSGLTIGAPLTPTTLADAEKRLRDSKKFDDVQVLKRFASIADPTKIVIVILVNEGPVRLEMPKTAGGPVRILKRGGIRNLMWLPILEGEDGYGVTFGVQLALVDVTGAGGRVSFPLTWGGTKQAGVAFERVFKTGALSRIEVGTGIQSRTNPAFQIADERQRVWVRAEKAVGPLRAGGGVGWQHVSFDADRDDLRSTGADLTLDTRVDRLFPRNAVYATASWERLSFAAAPSEPGIARAIDRTRLEARGYVGLLGPTVLALKAAREDADQPLPRYLESLLGGWSTLRGFQAGSFTGDTMVTGSIELRVPLTSALSVARFGVSAFVDTGTAYQKGQQFRNATFRTGIGGSVWVTAAFFQLSLGVAHGRGADTRVNFGGGLSF